MSYTLEVARLAEEITKRQRFLHPMLFDVKGRMYEDMRQKLLKTANFFIEKIIGQITALKASDILLEGSCAGYDYNQTSDINITIIVKSSNPSLILDTNPAVNELLSLIAFDYYGYQIFSKVNGIPVNIKFSAEAANCRGAYSLLKNEWVTKPAKEAKPDINIDYLIKSYFKKLSEISRFMGDLPMKDGVYSLDELERINAFFNQLNHPSAEEYPAYKLLCKSGQMQEFGADCVFAATDSLSLK